jgi:hypothetical protein
LERKSIKDIYQQIGKELHGWGAGKVILLSSRTDPESECIRLEIAAEGISGKKEIQKHLEERWPKLQIRIFHMENMKSAEQMAEIENDGIKL